MVKKSGRQIKGGGLSIVTRNKSRICKPGKVTTTPKEVFGISESGNFIESL